MIDDPASLLRDLRWREDMHVVNAFGEHVWLKPLIVDGKRLGITDCCFYDDPCERHKNMDGVRGN